MSVRDHQLQPVQPAGLQAAQKLANCLCADCVAMMPGAFSSSCVSPMAKRPANSGWNFMNPASGIEIGDLLTLFWTVFDIRMVDVCRPW